MTLEQVLASITDADRECLREAMDETTEADIRHYMVGDGEDPDAPLSSFQSPPDAKAAQTRHESGCFRGATQIPVAKLRNWEQDRVVMDLAPRSLLKVLDREPESVLRALAPVPSTTG